MVQCKCEDHAPTSHSWTGFKCQVMHCASSLQAWTCKLVLHNGTQRASVQIQLSSLICAPCDTFMWLWRSLLPWQQSCQIFKLRSLMMVPGAMQAWSGSPPLSSQRSWSSVCRHTKLHHQEAVLIIIRVVGGGVYCGVLCKSHMSHNRHVTVPWQGCGAASKQL
jgi:hypothetical protein